MPDKENERKLISIAMDLLSKRAVFQIEDIIYPEDLETKPQNPIDAIYKTTKGFYLIEHTILQSYQSQITEFYKIGDLSEIKKEIESKIKAAGEYVLALNPKSIDKLKINNKLLGRIKKWIIEIVPNLDIGMPANAPRHMHREYLEDLGFELCLCRWPCDKVIFTIKQFISDDISGDIRKTLIESLNNKLPKLAKWKNDYKGIALLILESVDISSINCTTIAEDLRTEITNYENRPDLIIILQSYKNGCELWMTENENNNLVYLGDCKY